LSCAVVYQDGKKFCGNFAMVKELKTQMDSTGGKAVDGPPATVAGGHGVCGPDIMEGEWRQRKMVLLLWRGS